MSPSQHTVPDESFAISAGYKWRIVALLWLIGALNYADRVGIASIYSLIRSDFVLSDVELAAVGSIFLLAYGLVSPLAGLLADRISRTRIIIWSLTGWSAVTLMTGFVTNMQQMFVMRALLGIFEAAYIPAAVGLIADYHESRTRATALGLHAAGLSIGVVAGGAGFGLMGEYVDWRSAFVFFGAAGLLIAGLAQMTLHDAHSEQRTPAPAGRRAVVANLITLVRIPSFIVILLASMSIAIGNWIFLNWLPLYFKETHGMSLAGAGFVGTFMFQGAGIVAGVVGSVFSDRIAGRAPRRRMLIQSAACFFAAPFLLVFLSPRPDLAVLNVCIFVFSFSLSFGACNITPLTCDLLPARLRSTAVGLGNAMNCMAGGTGIMVSGFLKAGIGLEGVFGGISAIILLCAGILLVGYLFFLERDLATAAAGP